MVRVGLVGYGMAGRLIHAPLLRSAGAQVAAVVSQDPGRADQARSDHRGVEVVPDLDALLGGPELDLVVLATPGGGHAAEAHRVLDAGLPLVVDKPFALDASQGQEVLDHAERAGVPLTVFQNRRFDTEFRSARAVVDAGTLGRLRRVEARWERWRPVPRDRWRETLPPEQGGGVLLDLGPHLLDWAVTLLGPVESVDARIDAVTTAADDEAFLLCRHRDGATSHLGMSSIVGAPGPWLRLLGDRAAYLLGDFNGDPNLYRDLADAGPQACGWVYRGPDDRQPAPRVAGDQVDFYRSVLAALGADDPQAAMPVDPRDSIHTLAVIDAARVSSDDGTVVEVRTPGVRPG